MTTITAAAGGGNWTTGATWTGGSAPTAADDAVLASTSGAVTVNAGAVCRSLDATNYTNTLTHTAGVTLTVGDGTAGAGNVALKWGAGMTYSIGDVATSIIDFVSTSATQQTVNPNGKGMPTTYFRGAGSSYVLGAAFTQSGTTGTLKRTAGTLATANFAITCGFYESSGTTTRVFTPGSSAIAITSTGGGQNMLLSGSNATWSANTSVVTLSGASASISAANTDLNGASIVFTTAVTTIGQILGGLTVKGITFNGAATKTTNLNLSGTTIATGTFTVTGNSVINRVLVSSATIGVVATVTATAVSLVNANFRDITATGTTWTGTSMGDCLGNTNITFDAPTTQTHTASAGGNWSDVTKWTSRVPLPQDNVVVNVSTTGTITADMPKLGADVTFAGFAGTADFTVPNMIFGSLVLGSGMTFSGSQMMTLAGRSSKTVTSNGKQFTQAVSFNAPNGTYTLTDNLSTGSALSVLSGTLVTAGFSTTSTTFNPTGNSSVVFSTSTINLTATSSNVWAWTSTGTCNAAQATFVYTPTSASSRTFYGGSQVYGTLTYTVAGSTGPLVITGANTFSTINFSDVTNARTLTLTSGTVTTVTTLNVNGTSGKLMTVNASTPGAAATLAKATGAVVSCDYLSLQDSTTTGVPFYTGRNSTVGTNVAGWLYGASTDITFGVAGAFCASATDPLTVTMPAGQDANSRTFMFVGTKTVYGSGIATPVDIPGWVQVGYLSGGSWPWTPATGADVGIVQTSLWYADGVKSSALVTLTAPGTVGVIVGQAFRFQRPPGYMWSVKMSYGIDSTSGADYDSGTTSSNFLATTGDEIAAFTMVCSDAGAVSAEAITATGLTLSTTVNRASTATSTGDDAWVLVDTCRVVSGTQSAPAKFTYTNASAAQGNTMFLRMLAVPQSTVTVTPSTTFYKDPYYQVSVSAISSYYTDYKIDRRDPFGEYADEPVRGGDLQTVPASGFNITDYEFHFGSLISGDRVPSYIVTFYNSGVVQYSVTVTPSESPNTARRATAVAAGMPVNRAPVTYICDTNAVNQLAVAIETFDEFGQAGTILGEAHVLGRQNNVTITDVATGMKGKFDILVGKWGTADNEDSKISATAGTVYNQKQVMDLLKNGNVFYMKHVFPSEVGIEDMYFVVTDVTVKRKQRVAYQLGVDAEFAAVMTISVSFTQQDRPATLAGLDIFTWQTVNDSNASWNDVSLGLLVPNGSWLDVLLDGQ